MAKLKYELSLSTKPTKTQKLTELVDSITTGLNPRKNFKLGEGDNYYVTIKSFDNGILTLDDRCDKISNEALMKINKRSKLKKGDILFSSIGRIGSTYLIDEVPENWNISESVFSIRAKDKVGSALLYMILSSKQVFNYVNANASGSAQQGIRISSLMECPIEMPDEMQIRELKACFEVIINEISALNKKIRLMKHQKQLLLNKYF